MHLFALCRSTGAASHASKRWAFYPNKRGVRCFVCSRTYPCPNKARERWMKGIPDSKSALKYQLRILSKSHWALCALSESNIPRVQHIRLYSNNTPLPVPPLPGESKHKKFSRKTLSIGEMSAVHHLVVSPKETAISSSITSSSNSLPKFIQRDGGRRKNCIPRMSYSNGLTILSAAVANPWRSSEEKVYDVVLKQAALVKEQRRVVDSRTSYSEIMRNSSLLNEAYDRCGKVCAEYSKTFYLGTLLMTSERQRAVWAIYVWCRRTDDLVDGPNASHITPTVLDQWEQRLNDLFEGRPYDMYDAALLDTVSKFPVDIQPFKDMIEGMRLDLRKSRYKNFDELYLYCYYVAGTVGLMNVPVIGIAPDSKASTESVYYSALALGIANQLTNILRDVGEDARRGRIYLPQDELTCAGLSEDDIFLGKLTDKWRNFMKGQIKRARMFFDDAEKGVAELNSASRWPVWASLMLYRQILDAIEANDYNNFTKRASVGKGKKIASLPIAYARALMGPSKSPKSLWI